MAGEEEKEAMVHTSWGKGHRGRYTSQAGGIQKEEEGGGGLYGCMGACPTGPPLESLWAGIKSLIDELELF